MICTHSINNACTHNGLDWRVPLTMTGRSKVALQAQGNFTVLLFILQTGDMTVQLQLGLPGFFHLKQKLFTTGLCFGSLLQATYDWPVWHCNLQLQLPVQLAKSKCCHNCLWIFLPVLTALEGCAAFNGQRSPLKVVHPKQTRWLAQDLSDAINPIKTWKQQKSQEYHCRNPLQSSNMQNCDMQMFFVKFIKHVTYITISLFSIPGTLASSQYRLTHNNCASPDMASSAVALCLAPAWRNLASRQKLIERRSFPAQWHSCCSLSTCYKDGKRDKRNAYEK